MSELRIESEGPDELLLVGHSPLGGLFAFAFAIGIYVLAGEAGGTVGTLARGLALVFAAFGLLGVLLRDSIRFDVSRRRWQRTRGVWPFLRSSSGSFETLSGIEVVEDPGFHRGEPKSDWEVWLRSAEAPSEVRLVEVSEEREARQKARHYAELLGLEHRAE